MTTAFEPLRRPVPVPRRVLLVSPQPFYQERGTPIAVRSCVEGWIRLGWEVDLLTYPIGRPVRRPGLRIFRCANPLGFRSVPIGISVRKLVLDAALVAALAGRLRRTSYALVHAVEEAAFPAVVLARRRGLPVLYDMQSSLPEHLGGRAPFRGPAAQRILTACERWLVRRADLVVGSTGLARYVRRIAPQARVREWTFPGRIREVAPEDVHAVRRELDLPDDAPTVVYTGTFESYQGLETLAEAMPWVLAEIPEVRFVLVGSTPDREPSLRAQLDALGLNGQVRLVPRTSRERVRAFLAAASLLVSPRRSGENLPLKIFDYMAAGRAIVASDLPVHRSLLDETRGLLVPPTAEGLAAGIVALLRDPSRAARLAASAREYAARHLDWAAFLEALDGAAREIVGEARHA